jgi:4-amino-4-deoxy-L-arabinose transferase-like glycosyltransferase
MLAPSLRPLSDRAHLCIAGCTLLVIASLVLFFRLGNGEMEVYDEGLYGMYAQNARHYDFYLHAIDEAKGFATGAKKFSKPPLSIWVTAKSMDLFGPSLFAMRFPFALASLGIAILLFFWGRQLASGARGSWLGFVAALLWLCSTGAHHWGRTATIEPLLTLFVMFALFAWGKARASHGRLGELGWCFLCGVGVSLAFFTKQLVCALAVVPIVVSELPELRRGRVGRVFARAFLALIVPGLLAGAWVWEVVKRVGAAARTVLLEHALLNRVAGYDGLQHKNYLNRIVDQLNIDAAPFSWQLGLLGLALCATVPGDGRERRLWRLLLPGMLAMAWLAFDVGSRSILPWYVVTFIPPLAFGNGWLIMRLASAAHSRALPTELGWHHFVSACGGALSLCALTIAASHSFTSAMFVGALFAALVALWVRLREREGQMPEAPRRSPWVMGALLALGFCVLLVGTAAMPGYRNNEPDVLSTLGQFMARHHVKRVALDPRDRTHVYRRLAFLGSTVEQGKNPWSQGPRAKDFQGWVEFSLVPNELVPRRGVALMRAHGAYGAAGDLRSQPFAKTPTELIDAGRTLTFEAEYMVSDRNDTLARVPGTSGGLVRTFTPRHREHVPKFYLAYGTTVPLPPGRYEVTFYLSAECTGFSHERIGVVRVATLGRPIERTIDCDRLPAKQGTFGKLKVPVNVSSAMPIDLSTRYDQGTLSLDRVTIKRQASPRPVVPIGRPKRPGSR